MPQDKVRTEKVKRQIGRALIDNLPSVMTQQQVADVLGISRRGVARIEELAVYKMFEAAEKICRAKGIEGVKLPI